MLEIKTVTPDIFCIHVPYRDIFVAIYMIRTERGTVLFDAAGFHDDLDTYILPALQQLGLAPTHIFISHNHSDHSGGLARAAELFPDAVILSRSDKLQETYPNVCHFEDGERLLDVLQAVTIPGHTEDSAALLDLRTGTLVSGDCLQSFGIYGSGRWYGNIRFPAAHVAAIAKLRTLPLETVATAHDYHPCGVVSVGKEAIRERLDTCIEALIRLRDMADAHPEADDQQVADLCNDGVYPTVGAHVITALRKAAEDSAFALNV